MTEDKKFDKLENMEIADEQLDAVAGGANGNGTNKNTAQLVCPKCQVTRTFRLASGGRAFCTECNEQIFY